MSSLPSPAPQEPLVLAQAWLDEAVSSATRNPWAMALASADLSSQPSVRFVLLKDLNRELGFVVFYTNYGSRKALELADNGNAAGAMYWANLGRQLRFEGIVIRSSNIESDAYFASRPRASQLNAWASRQSAPLTDHGELTDRMTRYNVQFAAGNSVPRPEFWGGYRLWLSVVEFWTEGADRFHQRLRYERTLTQNTENRFEYSAWRREHLQP